MSDLEFSFSQACYAAGAAEDAVKIRRREKHIFGSPPGDPEAIIRPKGRGPGGGLAMPVGGVVQLAIAERLIESGQSVASAYLIAFRFAFGGQSAPYWLNPNDDRGKIPPFNEQTDRAFGRLFSIGDTWLVVAPGATGVPGDPCFTYFSDHPSYQGTDRRTFDTINSIVLSVGEPVDGSPRTLLNVSDVCRNLADRLGVPFAEFTGEGV